VWSAAFSPEARKARSVCSQLTRAVLNRFALKRAAAHQAQIHGSGGSAAAGFGSATRTAPLKAKMANTERRSFFMIPSIKTRCCLPIPNTRVRRCRSGRIWVCNKDGSAQGYDGQ
jgi:hypothetical protein